MVVPSFYCTTMKYILHMQNLFMVESVPTTHKRIQFIDISFNYKICTKLHWKSVVLVNSSCIKYYYMYSFDNSIKL